MRKLVGGKPRAFLNHKTLDGRAYDLALKPHIAAFGGTIPPQARAMAKLFGKLSVRIDEYERERARAYKRRALKVVNRYDRRLLGMQRELARLDADLRAMAEQQQSNDFLSRLGGAR